MSEIIKYEPVQNFDFKTQLIAKYTEIKKSGQENFYQGKKKILIGMWDLGEMISGEYRGVDSPPSWRQMERDTGFNHETLKKWYDTYEKYPDKGDYIRFAEKKARDWTDKVLIENTKKQDTIATKWTGNEESYTPVKYIEKAREVMGSINIDPASNKFAQETVQADIYYTKEEDGLNKPWQGNIFLNPPYSSGVIDKFIEKLLDEIDDNKQAILLTNNNTDTKWFASAATACKCLCFTRGRINFYQSDGNITSPTNGQTFFYFGYNTNKFKDIFRDVGLIMMMF